MKYVKFVCPDCGGNQLEEIQVNCVVAVQLYDLSVVKHGTFNCEYGEESVDDATTERYQCEACGYILTHQKGDEGVEPESIGTPVRDVEGVGDWLKNHQAPEVEETGGIYPLYMVAHSLGFLSVLSRPPEEYIVTRYFPTTSERSAFEAGLREGNAQRVCDFDKQAVINYIKKLQT